MKNRNINKVAVVAGTMAIGFGVKHLINSVWRKRTGKEEAVNPADSNIKLTEALGWTLSISVLTGVLNTLYSRGVHKLNEGS
ncbi:MAG: DUF4235 domain-containing protein [Cyclobacteriaceae bacterium]|nr:DUF4235 domain-containing protein [Cyclobacteriaceae bacterium]